MQFFLFLALIFALIFMLLAIQNPTVITLGFIKWDFSVPLAFILALIFAAGILTGIFLLIPTWWRKVKVGRAQRRRIQELEKELLTTIKENEQSEE